MQEKEIERKLIFDGKLFRLWTAKVLINNQSAEREFLEHKYGSVGAVVLDEKQNIYLVREYRSAIGEMQTHLPGGGFRIGEETPEEAIIREIREEIGLRAKRVEKLFELHGGATWLWPQYFFLCTDLTDDPLDAEWDEEIEVKKLPFSEYLEDVMADPKSRWGDFKAVILVAKKLGLIDFKS